MIEIHRYTAAYHRDWNDFVSESSNGTFLFLREYMEYHADRFTDYSLLVYDGNKLLPCYRQTVRAMCCTRMPD